MPDESTAETEAVRLDIENEIATITLNKPEMRNALTADISTGIIGSLDEIEQSDVRCVVIEGAGDSFSAGGDIDAMMDGISGRIEPRKKVKAVKQVGEVLQRVYRFSLPVIAKIDGTAFGAGANLAIACDTQVASERSQISFGFRQVGLAVDSGTSYFLPRIVGENKAKELVFTGEMVDAPEAYRLGLFTKVFEDERFETQATQYIDRIATGPTIALETSKRLIRQGLQSNIEQAITNEAAGQAAVFETRDHEEGATAFVEQRDATFEGE